MGGAEHLGETVEGLLRGNESFAAYQRHVFGPIIDVRLDGRRIGDLPPTLGFTREVGKSVDEVVSVANVLVSQGHSDVALLKGEGPDFVAQTSAGRLLIEHTRAFTGYQEGSQGYLNRGMTGYRETSDYAAAVGNLSILISMERSAQAVTPIEAIEDPRPRGFLSKADAQKIMLEIRDLGVAGYFAAHADGEEHLIADTDAKTLAKYRATISASEALAPATRGIQLCFRMWKPGRMSLLDGCLVALEDKLEAVKRYVDAPDWLVIQVIDGGGEWAYDLADGAPEALGPFRKVLILYWHLWQPYVASWTFEGDKIVTDIPVLPPVPDMTDHRLHAWAQAVDDAMEERSVAAIVAANGDADVPKRFSSPIQIEWYRRWRGRFPWVTCVSNGNGIRMRFWIAGDWDRGEVVDVDREDVGEAADKIWAFIVVDGDTGS